MSPFCDAHTPGGPGGNPCAGCADARRAREHALELERNIPTEIPPRVIGNRDCPDHPGYPTTDPGGCAACAREREAVAHAS